MTRCNYCRNGLNCNDLPDNPMTAGYMVDSPCGDPIFMEYPTFSIQDSHIQCSGRPRPCKPWVNDLFRVTPLNNPPSDSKCPYYYTGPLLG